MKDKEAETSENEDNEKNDEEDQLEVPEIYTLEDSGIDLSKPISAAQLLAVRSEVLRQKKIHIGTLSSGLLENPEEKIMNLKTLLNIMDEETPEVYLTIRKLVIVSMLEVFKDILPSYEIKHINSEGVKCEYIVQFFSFNITLHKSSKIYFINTCGFIKTLFLS